jgi:hypothetical protein
MMGKRLGNCRRPVDTFSVTPISSTEEALYSPGNRRLFPTLFYLLELFMAPSHSFSLYYNNYKHLYSY